MPSLRKLLTGVGHVLTKTVNFAAKFGVRKSPMTSEERGAWPLTFHRGQFVRLRDAPQRFGVVLRAGEQPDEWLVAFADGERDVYLLEHLEPFVPSQEQCDAMTA